IGLSRLLDPIFRGWDRDDPAVDQKLKFKIGEDIYVQLVPQGVNLPFPWSEKDRLRLGDWLLAQTLALDFFTYDADGFPTISEKWRPDLSRIREEMTRARPVHMPFFDPPRDWTDYFTVYPGGVRAPFVRRDWRPETRAAISKALKDPNWQYARPN